MCHPFCARNEVESWPGENSVDRIRYLSGLEYERRFRDWIEGVGYDLEIYRKTFRQARVEWRISPIDDQTSALRITVYPEPLQGKSAIMRWLAHVAFIRPKLSSYLDSVVRGFEWYITKGEAVPRNQFGRHRWFSQRKQA